MKRIISALCLITFFVIDASAQLPNQNTYLLANKNDHPTANQYQYSACWGYRAPNGREYAIIGCQPGTAFYDITDSANIHEVGFVPSTLPGNSNNLWREMKVYSHYAYLVSEVNNSGIQIVDLQYLPDSVHYVKKFLFPTYDHTHSIQQSGPYLYINGGTSTSGQPNVGGVHVLDLTSDPETPTPRGVWGTQYVHDCRVVNDTIYACNIYNPPGTISVINATNKDNLQTITNWVNNPNPFPHNCALTNNRQYIFTTDETTSPSGKLKVWNISNLSNVLFVTSWQPTNITTCVVHNVEIYNNYAVIAHYEAGIRIVDISNPTTPTEVAWYDTYPTANASSELGCWGVFMFPSGKIIGSDTQNGLFVIKTTMNISGVNNNNNTVPATFSLKQNFPNPFNPSTTIRYDLPKASNVNLKVFDATGRQVALLADGYENAGSHTINYDAAKLASGIYYYSLTADGFSESKKMILLK